MSQIDLNALSSFTVVARHLNFRRAAAELAMAPSTLSDHIQKLERELGVRLFNRTTRSCALTEEGKRLLRHIGSAIQIIEEAPDVLSAGQDMLTGTLRINGSQPALDLCLMPLALSFMERYPGVRMELIAQGELIDVIAQGFDAGVRYDDTLEQDMVAVRLSGPQRMIVVGTPDYLARRGSPEHPDDLGHHECIGHLFARGNVLPWFLERAGARVDFTPRDRLLLNDLRLATQAVKASLGLLYTFEDYVAHELSTGELVRVLEAWTPAFAGPSLYYPERRMMPAALRAFVEHIKTHRQLG